MIDLRAIRARFAIPRSRMRTLDVYLLREWLRVFLITLFGFPILVIVIDLTDKMDQYLGRGLKPAKVALSYVFDLPEKMFLVLPVAVLFATVFTVGSLGRHSELTAAKASGISFHRLVRPLFIAAAASFLMGLLLGEISPVTTAKRLELLGEKAVQSLPMRDNFVYRADGGWVYAIRGLDLRQRQMVDLMLEREGSSADYPTIVVAAQRAVYSDSSKKKKSARPAYWTLHQGSLRYLEGNDPVGEVAFEFDSLISRTLRESPVDLLAQPKAPDEMRYSELQRYIDALTRSGSNAKKLQVELALKIAIPFICLLIALFGAPLAIATPKSGTAWGVAASLATTFIVLLMFQLAKAVGAGGVLPPALAAWVPNILVGGTAFYLLRKAPT
ncbi:MAG TPA: LptF/LptG family permease [Gemmatimonadales bacterium]|nr:LptF/LptG family permease [Gemmatimonadales bacterium]